MAHLRYSPIAGATGYLRFSAVWTLDGPGLLPVPVIQTQDSMGVGPRVKNFKNVNLKLNYHELDVEG